MILVYLAVYPCRTISTHFNKVILNFFWWVLAYKIIVIENLPVRIEFTNLILQNVLQIRKKMLKVPYFYSYG